MFGFKIYKLNLFSDFDSKSILGHNNSLFFILFLVSILHQFFGFVRWMASLICFYYSFNLELFRRLVVRSCFSFDLNPLWIFTFNLQNILLANLKGSFNCIVILNSNVQFRVQYALLIAIDKKTILSEGFPATKLPLISRVYTFRSGGLEIFFYL